MVFLALLPIVVILSLMLAFRWGASRAGAAGYLVALGLAWWAFGLGPEGLAYAHAKALLLSLDVLLIVWAAYLLFRVADEAGAIAVFGEMLPHLTADRGMQALLIGWAFASFLQGVGGFGVPVAVVAPLLVGLGFSPLAAVVVPSIGHGWAVTFGSLGSSFQALLAATGLPEAYLAPPAALFLAITGVLTGLTVLYATEGWSAVRRLWRPALVMGLAMGGTLYVVAGFGPWHIGSFSAGLVGLGIGFVFARRYAGAEPGDREAFDARALVLALAGYLVLLVIILAVQFIAPLKAFLGRVVLTLSFPEIRTALGYVTPAGVGRRIPLFRHAGALLFYAAFVAYLIYARAGRYRPGALGRILGQTARKMMASSVGILTMVTMAVLMQHAGMTEAIARGLARAVGAAYPLVAPWIGALGAFMTGSNTNSNVVFAALQMRTAQLLGYSVALILAAQTAGGALGSIIAPTKIIVGASTGGMAGREGEVLRRLGLYTLMHIAVLSLLAALGAALGLGL